MEARALADADALYRGGARVAIVENLGDAPFTKGAVTPATIAAMTRIVGAIKRHLPGLTLGVNVLRNDALGALAVAAATECRFIRVNVHVGAMVSDQGLLEGDARGTLLERNRLDADVRIAADVLVKHAVPLGDPLLEDVARDTWLRGRADALIVSGHGTGRPTDPERLRDAHTAVPDAPIWVGSGVTPAHLPPPEATAAIVGTWLHEDSMLDRPVDSRRVATMLSALGTLG